MRIVILSLGGTIASAPGKAGALPTLTAADLLAGIPAAAALADLTAVSFRQLPSAHLQLADVLDLAREIRARFAAGFDAAIVTQGTDTIEETAFALDLLICEPKAVVVTGAMRGPSVVGTDGAANLTAAVQVAASPAARDLGVVVVMNDEIHAARWVHKTHTASPATFRSPMTGPIGWLAEDAVRVALRPVGREAVTIAADAAAGEVALLTTALGDDGRLIDLARGAGYQGLVVEGLGGGHVNPSAAAALERAAAQMPVVIASRSAGETLRKVYGYVGSEIDLAARGLIFAGWLTGPKARLLLSLLIASGVCAPSEVAAEFNRRRDLI